MEGATHAFAVTEVSTMLALGVALNFIGLGFFCWVLFTLAIYALPFFVGMTVGLCIKMAQDHLVRSVSVPSLRHSSSSSGKRSSFSYARRSCGSRPA